MDSTYYTIGMAGHIDHGKTTLTKALTNIDTDRLKEEKERNISIELGYAPLETTDHTHVSIVDVPGHERFIRQMIAGVSGIDLVVLVIAADEGVMPQTKEHIEILEFLGVKQCIVAITKINRVDQELLELVTLDISETLAETAFKDAATVYVDSVSGTGVEQLKETIFNELKAVDHRDRYGSFRLPIDQVFTVQGQGTVVRGTIYEGVVTNGSQLFLLPSEKKVKARNIQVHHKNVDRALAGQRTAINVSGVEREEITRGDVLVASDHFIVTDTIDVSLRFVNDLKAVIKQRTPVKVHVGTSEVVGKIIFFDRNQVDKPVDEMVCQIRLDNNIVVRRGDRFILRRPSPVETIGGGWVIDPKGEKYRFGQQTINMLEKKKKGTPEDLVKEALRKSILLDKNQLIQATSLDEVEVDKILDSTEDGAIVALPKNRFTLFSELKKLEEQIKDKLEMFHKDSPMRIGMNKPELVQLFTGKYSKDYVEFLLQQLIDLGVVTRIDQFISQADFKPHLPPKWRKRMEELINRLEKDYLAVQKWEQYLENTPFSTDEGEELKNYIVNTRLGYQLTEDLVIHEKTVRKAIEQLKVNTGPSFSLKDAKDILGISRKYLIPLLELLDKLGSTKRSEAEREWVK